MIIEDDAFALMLARKNKGEPVSDNPKIVAAFEARFAQEAAKTAKKSTTTATATKSTTTTASGATATPTNRGAPTMDEGTKQLYQSEIIRRVEGLKRLGLEPAQIGSLIGVGTPVAAKSVEDPAFLRDIGSRLTMLENTLQAAAMKGRDALPHALDSLSQYAPLPQEESWPGEAPNEDPYSAVDPGWPGEHPGDPEPGQGGVLHF